MGIVTSTNVVFERTDKSLIPTPVSVRLCAEAGYRELDLCFVDLVTANTPFVGEDWESYLEGYADLAGELGIRFVQTHAPIHDFCGFQEGDERALELVKRSVRGTAMLNVPWIVMHPSTGVKDGARAEDTFEKNVAYFRQMADYCAAYGVGVAIENMWGNTREGVKRFAIEAEELLRLIEAVDRPNVGACWDTEHGSIEGLDQKAAIRLLGDRIKATHISDMTAPDNIHILPYTGFTDWDTVLGAFLDIRYQGVFAFEIQHYLLSMPMKLIPEALKFSRLVGEEMLRKIGR